MSENCLAISLYLLLFIIEPLFRHILPHFIFIKKKDVKKLPNQ